MDRVRQPGQGALPGHSGDAGKRRSPSHHRSGILDGGATMKLSVLGVLALVISTVCAANQDLPPEEAAAPGAFLIPVSGRDWINECTGLRDRADGAHRAVACLAMTQGGLDVARAMAREGKCKKAIENLAPSRIHKELSDMARKVPGAWMTDLLPEAILSSAQPACAAIPSGRRGPPM
uniref:Uncharacterized protein n=1 Tax=blood disease bacterium R229 TaxID=741978 RepID=G2ZXI2_9RALS|nr:hypothetical protein BDB_mp70215 [blood disease bacterium R229]